MREQRQQETSYIRARRFEGNKGGSKGAHLVAATVITTASPLHGGGGWGLVIKKNGGREDVLSSWHIVACYP